MRRVANYFVLMRTITPWNICWKLRKHAWQFIKRIQIKFATGKVKKLNFRQVMVSGIHDETELLRRIKHGPFPPFFISSERKDILARQFHDMFPDEVKNVVQAADLACQHVFDLLGSGPCALGESIDWQLDFKSGHRWDENAFYLDLHPAPYPGGYDIKVPWELSRCQHFTWLGQAYWLTGDENYALEFCNQINDWVAKNPPRLGVNWVCTMDVAIRAVNWLWGYAFFRYSPTLSDEFHLHFYNSLLDHGKHIINNLEWSAKLTSNHFLSDIVGLVYLGLLLPELKDAKTWREVGLRELESEMFKQVYPDGVNFEASTGYHRLTTELFLSATLLAELNGHTFSNDYIKRLEAMINVIHSITRPDGTVALIGDQDNGRLHRLKVWANPDKEWADFRYLLGIAAAWKKSSGWETSVGNNWEEAFWIFGEQIKYLQTQGKTNINVKNVSIAYPDGGWYIMRSNQVHIFIKAGNNGQNGIGGHSHNDLFSFDLFAEQHEQIIDCGTYTYTQNYSLRNQFRATTSHNTVRIDNSEINPITPESIFKLRQTGTIHISKWDTTDNWDYLDVWHDSYKRLPHHVFHRRQFLFKKRESILIIRDSFLGEGVHRIENFFQVNADIENPDLIQNHALIRSSNQEYFHFYWNAGISELKITQGETSGSYGQRRNINRMILSGEHALPHERLFVFNSSGTNQLLNFSPLDIKEEIRFYEIS